jgi:hypothetical protein
MTAIFELLLLPALRRSKEQKIVHTSAEPGLFLKAQTQRRISTCKNLFMVHDEGNKSMLQRYIV